MPKLYSLKRLGRPFKRFPLFLTVAALQVPGESLQDIWASLPPARKMKVLYKLVDLHKNMFFYRGQKICTDLKGTNIDTRRNVETQPSVLLTPPFSQGPLQDMAPQPAVNTVKDYLYALAHRMDRVFSTTSTGAPTAENLAARKDTMGNPHLTQTDVDRIKETWRRLATLVPHHSGGFYIPGHLSVEARRLAYGILQSQPGIRHQSTEMSRYIVQFHPPTAGNPEESLSITLTGWEHAHYAPLWSCARVPTFLLPRPFLPQPRTTDEQETLREIFVNIMINQGDARQWTIAYIFGSEERWFEDTLSAHWIYRDTNEVRMKGLKGYWIHKRPDIQFPLPTGDDYIAPGPLGYLREGGMRPPPPSNREIPIILDIERREKYLSIDKEVYWLYANEGEWEEERGTSS